ncbi:U box domain containing protein [Babesia divergens]|uniref:RING-type E3 ubiquitin transferase n=1 Tax=Babesia divergens TaxID=32595 RepID=A0AAD9LH34_BABDI|nr:U box domain containing protein [Babesia divergens]
MVTKAVIDRIVKDVLNVALKKSERATPQQERQYVGQFFTRIRGITSTENISLDVEDIDDAVRAAVFACILHGRNPLLMLGDAYTRCAQANAAVEAGRAPFHYIELAVDGKFSEEDKAGLLRVLASIKQFVVSNATLLIICPMFFNIEDLVAKEDLKKPPLNTQDQNVRCKVLAELASKRANAQFVQALISDMVENDDVIAKEELYRTFDHIRLNVSLMPIGEKPTTELVVLTNIATSKIGAAMLVEWVKIHDMGNVVWKSSGVKREISSLFGRILSSLPMTEEHLESAKLMGAKRHIYENAISARKNNFYGKRDISGLRMAFATLREEHESYMEQVATFIKTILRTETKTREDMLVVIGQLLSLNASKRHMSRLTHVDQAPVTLDDIFRRRRLFIPDSTYGTSLNVMWILLILAGGITEQKVGSIDPNFCQLGFYIKHKHSHCDREEAALDSEQDRQITNMRNTLDRMLGFLSTSNAGMGDEHELIAALEKQNIDILEAANANFITQIFWITLHGLGMLYLPSLQEFLKLVIFTLQTAQTSSDPMNDQTFLEIISNVFTWKCVLQHSKFVEALWHYINISLVFFLRCALLTKREGVEVLKNTKLAGRALSMKLADMYASGTLQDSDDLPAQFTVLPVEFIEIILDVVKHIAIMRYYVDHLKPQDVNVLEFMDFDLIMATCVYIMKAPQKIIKNITLKCDTVSSIILNLSKTNGIDHFERSNFAKHNLVDALTNTFILSQKADYSSRVTCRLNIIQTLTRLFEINAYRNSFMTNIITNKENFVQFMHLLLNDTSFIFEEVVTFLSEIRRRELAGITDESGEQTQQRNPSTSSHRQAEQDDEVDPALQEGSIDANQLKNMTFKELQGRTSTLVEYGSEITTLLHILCREFHNEITSMSVLLPQVASCLGCCLESLAGEHSSNLKVKNMMQYNFRPKDWLANIVRCYLTLYGGDKHEQSEPLMKAIVSEGRYFKPTNFERAFRIATREMLLNSKDRRAFFNMSQKLCQYAKATNTLYQHAMEAEIPEEFMDPIMMDIMEDPVLLPTSGTVMDRKNIERHLMSEATDPFSRQPLTKAQLLPQPELKNRIDEFLAALSRKDAADDIYQA